MATELHAPAFDNVIPLDRYRQRQAARQATPAGAAGEPEGGETVFFVTGGMFEAMVNGTTAMLVAGDFVRVADGMAYGFNDVGSTPGALLTHRFAVRVASGFLAELAAALPPFVRAFPPRGTAAYARLKAIARRWGVVLGSNEAA
jgi:hypothetical protein